MHQSSIWSVNWYLALSENSVNFSVGFWKCSVVGVAFLRSWLLCEEAGVFSVIVCWHYFLFPQERVKRGWEIAVVQHNKAAQRHEAQENIKRKKWCNIRQVPENRIEVLRRHFESVERFHSGTPCGYVKQQIWLNSFPLPSAAEGSSTLLASGGYSENSKGLWTSVCGLFWACFKKKKTSGFYVTPEVTF